MNDPKRTAPKWKSSVPSEFTAERDHQLEKYPLSGDVNRSHILLDAAACYLTSARVLENPDLSVEPFFPYKRHAPEGWPWALGYWKPDTAARMREKAAALTWAAWEAQVAEYPKGLS